MKKLVSCIAIALCAAILAGCGPKTPDAVALKFVQATAIDGDIEAAKKYMSEDTKKLVDAAIALGSDDMKKEMKKTSEKAKKAGAKASVKDTKIDGDKATVVIAVTGKGEDGKEETQTETVNLVKENGEWKVAVKK